MSPATALLLVAVVLLPILVLQVIVLLRLGGLRDSAAADLTRVSERLERELRDEIARSRNDGAGAARDLREELGRSLERATGSLVASVGELARVQQAELASFSRRLGDVGASTETRLEGLRGAVEMKLGQIQADNAARLEEMRRTVDEKLSSTLETRLGESFKLVSERLEQVHKGLGEMHSLASGVGDLKRVLTNVKTRGTWGEVQLGALLEQILSREQYELNVATRPGSSERVEYAIRLPGRGDEPAHPVWLPIDAKFPVEDHERLLLAVERGDPEGVEEAARALEARVREEARTIQDKYLAPPDTTDFALLFLPSESLYAEVLRRPGLVERLQQENRVVVTGPTTLAALLNSLQMGFRTLAIQQRSSEVWKVLGAVKAEFVKFGAVIDKVKKKLGEASSVVEQVEVRSRQITRSLRSVEELPAPEAAAVLGPHQPALEPDPEANGAPAENG